MTIRTRLTQRSEHLTYETKASRAILLDLYTTDLLLPYLKNEETKVSLIILNFVIVHLTVI